MSEVKSICVFCGSSNNIDEEFFEEGKKLGKIIADKKFHLVFGAGDCGVMGAVANSTLDNGGTVTGVFPKVLEGLEEEHKSLTETFLVEDMHTRKKMMYEKSDAFVILPGGFGTMDETFEVITWKQLYTHDKPIVFYNYNNYWQHFINLTNQFIDLGFAAHRTKDLFDVVDSVDEIFDKI